MFRENGLSFILTLLNCLHYINDCTKLSRFAIELNDRSMSLRLGIPHKDFTYTIEQYESAIVSSNGQNPK